MKEHNPIQVLMDEHEVICSAESIISSLDKSWEKDENSYVENVNKLLVFFKEYSDGFHHRKEEDVLFKELNKHPDFKLQDIITELEEHHQGFRDTIVEIAKTLGKREWARTQDLLSRYVDDLLNHIAVENDELFIIAESVFSEEELERMFYNFEDIESQLGKDHKIDLVK